MKKPLSLIIILIVFFNAQAADWVKINNNQPAAASISLVSSDVYVSTVDFSITGFYKNIVSTENGDAWLLSVDNGAPSILEGMPDLPVFATSLMIPDQANMELKVVSSQYKDFENVLIAPSKGNLSRQVDPSTVDYNYGRVYNIDAFYPGKTGKLTQPYIIRDFRGQALIIQPFQYNPVTKVLRVFFNIRFEVFAEGESSDNIITGTTTLDGIDSRFAEVYKRHFINYSTSQRYDPVDEEGNMIIISYGDFIDAVQPLADWKTKSGIACEVVDVADIGDAPAIKQYIQDAYDEGNLTFVLLVGDAAQVPSSESQGNDSDVDYSYTAGDDHYPDLFVGRFSAETEAHVNTMVNRTLTYEMDPSADTAWYSKAIAVGSNEGPGDDGEMDYEHLRNIGDNKLIPFTYNYAYELFEGSQGGNDEDGNPSASDVAEAINSGASVINYTGHGSTTSWGTSGFSNSDINGLTNAGMWPFIISVACVNGNFVNATCFAETWTRASDNGEPTGAIATIMSTINQSWNPPMRGQDEMADILTEAQDHNIKRTFGGVTMNGVMNMNDIYGNAGYTETDTWTIFGDPSVMLRTANPAELTVAYVASIPLGESSFTVSCDVEGALAALSMDGVLLGTAKVESGAAIITFEPVDTPGTADVVVTAFNYKPFISEVEFIPVDGPFIVYTENSLNDPDGNGVIDYDEEGLLFTIGLSNIGLETAEDISAVLSTDSEFVTINNANATYGEIIPGDTVYIADGFDFSVAEDVPDGQTILFSIETEDVATGETWESNFTALAHAPVLSYLNFTIDDSEGNNDGMLDPGEIADLEVLFSNSGSSAAYNVVTQLVSNSDYLTIVTTEQAVGDLASGEESQLVFKVQADGDAPDGHIAELTFELAADHNINGSGDFNTIIGKKPVLVIDFANDQKSVDSLSACFNILTINAEYASAIPETINTYRSVFVLLGIYPDNYQLESSQGTLLANYLQNGGNIYMEGGDTWFYDDATDVHPMFSIKGDSDGGIDLAVVIGEVGSFLSGHQFNYAGNDNYIDQISPLANAVMLMSNEDPYYGVAVANDAGDYKTIGTSFNFAGLVDEEGSSKDGVIASILDFFEIGYIWTSTEEFVLQTASVNAYPNPFKGQVNFDVTLEQVSNVSVEIFDLTGRVVTTLVQQKLNAGKHSFSWNADENATAAEPGIYFYRMKAGKEVVTKKLILSR
jgi:hypothetical protein